MFETEDYNSWDQAGQMASQAFEMYENGEMTMALTQLQEAIEINPNNNAWHFNKGLTLDALDRFEEAIQAYERALALNPDDPETMNCLAVDYTRTGQYDLSLSLFGRIENIDPSFEPCYCNRIITYTEIDQHDKAEEMFYLAQQINPDCPICFYNIGNSLFSRQQFEKAIWCWKKTAMLEPAHPQINYRIAQAYWAGGDPHQARQYFLEELRNAPGDLDVILDFGIFLLKHDDIDAAREKFNRITEFAPNFAPALFYMGELELALGNRLPARRFFKQAISKDSCIPGPRFRLAQLAIEDDDTDDAHDYLRDEYELDICDVDVLLAMGSTFLQIDEPDYATDCFLRVIEEDRDNIDAFYCLGRALVARGEIEGAIQFFEHSITLGRKDMRTLVQTAELYLKTGRLGMAAKTIAVARTLAPTNRQAIRLSMCTQTALLADKLKRRLERSWLYQKFALVLAGYRCRIRRVIRSRIKHDR